MKVDQRRRSNKQRAHRRHHHLLLYLSFAHCCPLSFHERKENAQMISEIGGKGEKKALFRGAKLRASWRKKKLPLTPSHLPCHRFFFKEKKPLTPKTHKLSALEERLARSLWWRTRLYCRVLSTFGKAIERRRRANTKKKRSLSEGSERVKSRSQKKKKKIKLATPQHSRESNQRFHSLGGRPPFGWALNRSKFVATVASSSRRAQFEVSSAPIERTCVKARKIIYQLRRCVRNRDVVSFFLASSKQPLRGRPPPRFRSAFQSIREQEAFFSFYLLEQKRD